MLKRIAPWLLLAAGALVLLWGLVPIIARLLGANLGAGVVAEIKLATDLNPWVEKLLLTVLGVVATGIFFKLNLTLSWTRQLMGVAAIGGIWALTYGFLAYHTSDPIDGPWFTTGGSPLRCYVLDRDSVRLLYVVERDPKSGQVCRKVTQELEPQLRGWLVEQRRAGGKLKLRPVESPSEFFAFNGTALIWYHQRPDGTCDYFQLPGVHPQHGVPLIEIDRDKSAACQAAERRARQAGADKAAREAAEARERAQRQQQTDKRHAAEESARQRQASYVGATVRPGSTVLATAQLGDLASIALEIAREQGQTVALKPGFVSDGLFDAVWNGGDELSGLGLERARAVLLVRAAGNASVRRSPELQGLTYIRQDFSVLLHKSPYAATPQTVRFTAEGRAFNEGEARDRLSSDFADKLRSSLAGRI